MTDASFERAAAIYRDIAKVLQDHRATFDEGASAMFQLIARGARGGKLSEADQWSLVSAFFLLVGEKVERLDKPHEIGPAELARALQSKRP